MVIRMVGKKMAEDAVFTNFSTRRNLLPFFETKLYPELVSENVNQKMAKNRFHRPPVIVESRPEI